MAAPMNSKAAGRQRTQRPKARSQEGVGVGVGVGGVLVGVLVAGVVVVVMLPLVLFVLPIVVVVVLALPPPPPTPVAAARNATHHRSVSSLLSTACSDMSRETSGCRTSRISSAVATPRLDSICCSNPSLSAALPSADARSARPGTVSERRACGMAWHGMVWYGMVLVICMLVVICYMV
jgi:hypothetical protein